MPDTMSSLATLIKSRIPKQPEWIYCNDPRWVGTANQPLTSTSWDGDSFSTTAKTLIDLSAVFGVPAGVKAVLVKTRLNDSGSLAGSVFMILAPHDTANEGPYIHKVSGFADNYTHHHNGTVPCDANGDIYYQLAASGASTLVIYLQIYGYYL